MRRMLDPKEAGGSLPSTIKFDTEGNRTVGKNLGVDGKLTLKSLVSGTNPDGDITKELGKGGGGGTGGSARHVYSILIGSSAQHPETMHYEVYTDKNYDDFPIGSKTNIGFDFMTNDKYKELRSIGCHPVSGVWIAAKNMIANLLEIKNDSVSLSGYVLSNSTYDTFGVGRVWPVSIIKLS